MTRFELLQYVKADIIEGLPFGLCYEIWEALISNGLGSFSYEDIPKLLPAFTRENALQFGASAIRDYWWPIGKKEGRLDFLNWLIDYYKDDKTDLNNIQL